ncbi:MAG: hypothetical protein H7839_19970 [Magnetococcus sp. YQC-5]
MPMTRKDLEAFLRDARNEPEWRTEADKAAQYYDGDQLDTRTMEEKERRGSAPTISNHIAPTINLVLGMQAKSPRDWKVVAATDDGKDVADVLTEKMKEVEKSSGADRACSEAYAAMIKTGMGWIEVSKESNPFLPPFRVTSIHRREMYWDWRSVRPDLSDARFIFRRAFFDADLLAIRFPRHKTLIKNAVAGWAEWDMGLFGGMLSDARYSEMETDILESEWRDTERKRLCLYEVWYKTWITGPVIKFQDGKVSVFDQENPQHVLAVYQGTAQIENRTYHEMRLAWWLGPHLLEDIPSPYPHSSFPYVPFFGFRKDAKNQPYGMIKAMISPQDSINVIASKILDKMAQLQVIATTDSLGNGMTFDTAMTELSRPDAVITLAPNKMDHFVIREGQKDILLYLQLMNTQVQNIQSLSGVFNEQLGKGGVADSGVAINALVEQGGTTLAEINDNYVMGRRAVGELLLELVRESLTGEQELPITRNGKQVSIRINSMSLDDNGIPYLTNGIAEVQTKIVLEDVPESPSAFQQKLRDANQLMPLLPPQLAGVIGPELLVLSGLFPREKMQELMGGSSNQDQPGVNIQQQEDVQQQALLANQQAAMQMQMAQEAHQAGLRDTDARTRKTEAEIEVMRMNAAMNLAKSQLAGSEQNVATKS